MSVRPSAAPVPTIPVAPVSRLPDAGDDDVVLAHALVRGDREALAQLYDRHASFLMTLAFRMLRDRREAEDLLHDVFLEAWRSAAAYDPARGTVRTWLAVRMRSRALDRLKSARVQKRAGDDQLIARVAAVDIDSAGGVDAARVRAALDVLRPDQRAIIELAYFEGASCSEIARALTIPVGTVKSRMASGMRRLRDALLGEGAPS